MSINGDVRNPPSWNGASSSSSSTSAEKTSVGRQYVRIENDRLVKTNDLKSASSAEEINKYIKEHGIQGTQDLKVLKDAGVEICQIIEINQLPPEVVGVTVKFIDTLSLKKSLICGDRVFNVKYGKIIKEELLARNDHGLPVETFLEYFETCKSKVKTLYFPLKITSEQLSQMIQLVGTLQMDLCLEYLEIDKFDENLPLDWTKYLPQSLLTLKIHQIDLSLESIEKLPRELQTLIFHMPSNTSLEELDNTPQWINKLPQHLKSLSCCLPNDPGSVNLSNLPMTLKELILSEDGGCVSIETIPRSLLSLSYLHRLNADNVDQLPPNLVSLTAWMISQDCIKDLPRTLRHLTFSFDTVHSMNFEDFPRELVTLNTNSLPKGDVEKLPQTLTECTLNTTCISKEDLKKLPPSLTKLNFWVDIGKGEYLYELPIQLKELIIFIDPCQFFIDPYPPQFFNGDIDWKKVSFEHLTELTLSLSKIIYNSGLDTLKFDEFNACLPRELKKLKIEGFGMENVQTLLSKISHTIDHVEIIPYSLLDEDPFVMENGWIRTDLKTLPSPQELNQICEPDDRCD